MTNDDGPPSAQSSPYILSFVQSLEAAGHTVSVIIPDVQRSWIGKAHIVGQDVQTTPYWPPATNPEVHRPVDTAVSSPPTANDAGENVSHPWILVNSTPATCAQLGLGSHFFESQGPIDLVISGPNYGRNTTAVFALSSGTLGAALEAAACGYRSIALSFAFFDRINDPAVVAETSRHAVKVCEWLGANADFGEGRLYSVNVPVQKDVSSKRVIWTRMLQNQWKKGACFQELRSDNGAPAIDPGEEEVKIRRRESNAGAADGPSEPASGVVTPATRERQKGNWQTRHFKWSPRFTDVYESVEKAGPGSDGWTVKAGETSVTALRANFMHVDGMEGEVKL